MHEMCALSHGDVTTTLSCTATNSDVTAVDNIVVNKQAGLISLFALIK
jgi:hypothetical protein